MSIVTAIVEWPGALAPPSDELHSLATALHGCGAGIRPLRYVNSWVRLAGCLGSPSTLPQTHVSPDCLTPRANSASACACLCLRNSAIAKEGRATPRPLSDFVDLNRSPALVCSRLSTTLIAPRSRSTLHQRKAKISPGRNPVAKASRTGQ